jgi:hypothetical protein
MSRSLARCFFIAVLLGTGAAVSGCVAVSTPTTIRITEKADAASLVAPVGTTLQVTLKKMRWTEIRASDEQSDKPVLRQIARPTPSEDGVAAVTYVADHPGKVLLMAQGRARCAAGEACPHFLLQWSRTIEVVAGKP